MIPQQKLKLFHGEIILADNSQYDKARDVFYGGINKKPLVIIKAKDSSDVTNAIKLAKEENLELAIRSGGHSVAGHSTTEGGILLDLREINEIKVDEKEKTVWVGSGVTAGELTQEIDKYNLVIGFGDTGSVGIGGITLGGGIGYLVRKFGMAIDNLLAAKIVTAEGEELEINEDNHADLFWAIRGGGGNFGVVTHFKFKLHDLSNAYGGMMILPMDAEVLNKYIELSDSAPEELSSIINVMPLFPMPGVPEDKVGKLGMMALIMYAGDPKEGEKVIKPFRELAKPFADMIRPLRYKEMFPPEDPSYKPKAVSDTLFMNNFNLDVAKTIVSELENFNAPFKVVQLRVLGGAMAKVDKNKTAFAHRNEQIMANVASFYETDKEKAERRILVDNLSKKLKGDNTAAYVNFLEADYESRLKGAYPEETLKRLTEVKRKYDPENLFKLNYNIKP